MARIFNLFGRQGITAVFGITVVASVDKHERSFAKCIRMFLVKHVCNSGFISISASISAILGLAKRLDMDLSTVALEITVSFEGFEAFLGCC